MADLTKLVDLAMGVWQRDHRDLQTYDDYHVGKQARPYSARGQTDEFKALADRSIFNWIRLAVNIPCQMSVIEGYRIRDDANPPEYEAFTANDLDRKQFSIHEAACVFGHSFAEVMMPHPVFDKNADGTPVPTVRALSTKRTVALYNDDFNDRFPVFAVEFDKFTDPDEKEGQATAWTETERLRLAWDTSADARNVTVVSREDHGFTVVPIVRWVVHQDLEGRTTGLVSPLIQPQNDMNQGKYDLTVTRNFSAYKIRTASGLEGEPLIGPDGQQVIDDNGDPVFLAPEIGPEKFLSSEDEATKFGTLDETPLDGFIASLNQSVEHFSAVSQIPPHALIGRMANLSADAMVAAEEQLMRLVESLQRSWGESWTTLFQLISFAQGNPDALKDHSGLLRWKDMRARALSSTVDALGKGAQMLQIPPRELWKFWPGADAGTLQQWNKAYDEQPPVELTETGNAANLSRSLTGLSRTSSRGQSATGEAPSRRSV